MREREMVAPVARHFERLGYETFEEVPVGRRRADLVAVSSSEVLALELKLRAWRRALRQAIAYQVWATEASVVLPFAAAHRAARHRHRFQQEGVGLLALLGEEVRTFVAPGPSPRRFTALGDWVGGRLRNAAERDAPNDSAKERF